MRAFPGLDSAGTSFSTEPSTQSLADMWVEPSDVKQRLGRMGRSGTQKKKKEERRKEGRTAHQDLFDFDRPLTTVSFVFLSFFPAVDR